MADIDLKTETPDTSLPTTGFLFGADSQSAASPSVYSTQAVATALLGSTSLTGATVTADSPVLNLAQTWNNSGVTFTGLKFNVPTDSSAADSLLMDLQVGGSSRFNVSKTGSLKLGVNPTGTNQAGTNVIIAGSQGTGTGAGGSIVFQVAPAGSSGTAQNALATALTIAGNRNATFEAELATLSALRASGGFLYLGTNVNGYVRSINNTTWSFIGGIQSAASLGLTSSVTTSADVILARDTTNTLALRNGANAQFLRVYSTYTDASNYERGAINTGADFVELAAETAGTGDDNLDVRLTPAGTGNVRFGTHTGTADTAVSGYIEIKDAGGTIRKLAVIT